MIASVSPLFGAERTFERPSEGLLERLWLAEPGPTTIGSDRPSDIFRAIARSPARCKVERPFPPALRRQVDGAVIGHHVGEGLLPPSAFHPN